MRKEIIGDCTLYLYDCHSMLADIPDNSAIVSDPPYGIAFQRGVGGQGKHSVRNRKAIVGDAHPFDPAIWLSFPEVVLWGANHYAQRLPHGRWLAWDKLAGVPEYDDFSDVEFAWIKGRGKDRIFSHLWKGICKASEKGGKERWHPTQKPVALMERCLKEVAGSPIVDPYMGSGTTGVACAKAGRQFIGIEIDEGYFNIACERIRKAYAQPDMFVERPAPPQQLSMLGAAE
ncbi:DNA-methyltransferase [Ancylobacter oerskovii]|uniref:Methyltransferase n=1 Tax=Ancylobacter oerskovii TaxID=459519 RepID=A0ABW4Z1R8_9HYPH|nr:site-specific DNA-methyltransferase [Ancylobacter oerskovii]MBS7545097.1 site-specific DNA-methyltransferase [Ancylobacter oerskovii]